MPNFLRNGSTGKMLVNSPPSEAWLFAQGLLGAPIPVMPGPIPEPTAEPELLEWLSTVSTALEAWDPDKHPRGGFPQNRGWFSHAWGAGGAQKVGAGSKAAPSYASAPDSLRARYFTVSNKTPKKGTSRAGATASARLSAVGQQDASDPSRWYLPADDKGEWIGGQKGHGTFRLKTPLEANGKIVREIEYKNRVPVLDKFALPGKSATIVLTGDSKTDIRNAERAWKNLNPGKSLPPRSTFHHDLLHVVEETHTINGKKTKVLVGKMHLVPTKINQVVFHEGSAGVAKKFYQGLGIDVAAVKELAKAEASLAGRGSKVVAKATKKIIRGNISKGVLRFVGRNVVRAIPIAGTGLAILEFSDNVEAHGVGGAVARTIPVLGSLISAHDLGSDLAKQITDEANAAADLRVLNADVTEAWKKASEQTIEAFHELTPQIQVTNVRQSGQGSLVNPHEIADALRIYRNAMQRANYFKSNKVKVFDFDAEAARNKQELKESLTTACQKNAPRTQKPAL